MRITLEIDDDVLAAARDITDGQRRPVGHVLSDLARRSLRPVGITEREGLPTFDVPSDAPPVTAADVARGLDG